MQKTIEASAALMSMLTEMKKLESSFTSVIMEAVLKLVKITDSKIFILIENESVGRCFGGSQHFCDDYRGDGLRATHYDYEMEVDMDVSSLSTKRVDGNDQEPDSMNDYNNDSRSSLFGSLGEGSQHSALALEQRKNSNESKTEKNNSSSRRKRKVAIDSDPAKRL